ncbi:ATP synthase F0F1 subunit B [Kocuria flava]|uniref:ATP synthase subunit b n=1 Tax=Kocuria flava TaxID=446860 RepID=A0A0U3G6N8_9MICC|nr:MULTISPECIES: F0F1 ATP synthase subunit B [Kocuria]ALU40474.1 ATP synthase F0F1 subunit B [Kocuria flava]MCD1145671.1 F0F1 ATP synthase subunit B [Kocuria sp. LUK]MCJ8505102.1 F0F1 ATP synthase subunit B [Kocuria flava]PLC12483.1 ATP synthase F0F1 subunit B [Kocuria flava]GEO93553.1 ATP synthase subunit b [Kocuria flava]
MTLVLAAEEGANPLFPNVWEMAITLIGFLILLFLVVKFVVPAFERVYQERTEAIEGGLAKAKAAQAEAAAARDEYNQQLESARLEAQKIREEARTEGEKILADFKDRANAESARITENAHRTIEAERSAAVVSLRNEVGVLATQLASKIVGETLDDDARANRVVDRFLADLEADQQRNAGAAR